MFTASCILRRTEFSKSACVREASQPLADAWTIDANSIRQLSSRVAIKRFAECVDDEPLTFERDQTIVLEVPLSTIHCIEIVLDK
jgi:hypothetical protein